MGTEQRGREAPFQGPIFLGFLVPVFYVLLTHPFWRWAAGLGERQRARELFLTEVSVTDTLRPPARMLAKHSWKFGLFISFSSF